MKFSRPWFWTALACLLVVALLSTVVRQSFSRKNRIKASVSAVPPRAIPADDKTVTRIKFSPFATTSRPTGGFRANPVSVNAPSEIARFEQWTEHYLATTKTNRMQLESEGLALAVARRSVMKNLIGSDPEQALLLAITPRVRAALPDVIAMQLEREISGEGFYGVLAICNHGAETDHAWADRIEREVRIGEEQFQAHVYGSALERTTVEKASIYGVAIDNELALREENVVLISPADIPNVDPATPGVAGIYKGGWYWFEDAAQVAAFEESLVPVAELPTAAAGPTLDPAAPPPSDDSLQSIHGKLLPSARAQDGDGLASPCFRCASLDQSSNLFDLGYPAQRLFHAVFSGLVWKNLVWAEVCQSGAGQ